jgi:uncharacterized protein YxeA
MKTLLGAIVVLVLIAVGAYVYTNQQQDTRHVDATTRLLHQMETGGI